MSPTSNNGTGGNENSDAQLMEAIKSATVHRLQTVLQNICNSSLDAKRLAQTMLLVPGDQNLNSNGKRPLPSQRYEVCVQCEKEFDILDNPEDACKWHEGDLEPDDESDFWADTDEATFGPIDSDFNREEYPEGFRWTCCEKLGTEEGCQVGPHAADMGKRSRN